MGFAPSFCAEAFCTLILQGRLRFKWVFMGTRHSEATRTSVKMGRSEVGGGWGDQTTKEYGAGEEQCIDGNRKKPHRKLLW